MLKFYLVETPGGVLPDARLVQVKGKTDCTMAVCFSHEALPLEEKSDEEVQSILNAWIDTENLEPALDIEGSPIILSAPNVAAIRNHFDG
jgi:hypothetical protein